MTDFGTAAVRRFGRAREAGAASILVLACAGILVAASAVVTGIAASVAARHHLAAVADGAALAAAAVVDAGAATACRAAASVAGHNGATLVGCRVTGPVVTVRVEARMRWPLTWLRPLALNSCAGPAETNVDHLGQPATAS